MKVVIQRVTQASVTVEEEVCGKIGKGILVLVGFSEEESEDEMRWIAKKIVQLRIFNDSQNVMNLSVQEVQGEILLVSQFTLMASTKKGNRPSYIQAAKPAIAEDYYDTFIRILEESFDQPIQKGKFGADMKVSLLNEGPVTIIIDSKNKS